MTSQHPITPPPELVEQWFMDQRGLSEASRQHIATRAAQWGADQELEACCKWLAARDLRSQSVAPCLLRIARRPKPPSLKEQALTALTRYTTGEIILTNDSVDIIRRALEQLS
jgi:hypothetical protein